MNVWTGAGRLVTECELQTLSNGTNVCSFAIAVKKDEKIKEGDRDAWLVDCVAWDSKAEFLAQNAYKGDAIAVTGPLRFKTYDKNNTHIKTVECICDRVDIIAHSHSTIEMLKNHK